MVLVKSYSYFLLHTYFMYCKLRVTTTISQLTFSQTCELYRKKKRLLISNFSFYPILNSYDILSILKIFVKPIYVAKVRNIEKDKDPRASMLGKVEFFMSLVINIRRPFLENAQLYHANGTSRVPAVPLSVSILFRVFGRLISEWSSGIVRRVP